MATTNKSSLDFVLQSVLAVANKEANMDFPPRVFSQIYNTVSSFVKDALVRGYPASPMNIDILDPFVKVEMIPATNGFIQLPDDYSDLLGTPMIFASPDGSGQCAPGEPLTAQNFKTGILKSGCRLNAVVIVPQAEFAELTISTYNAPTYEEPIGYFSGKKQIRICPYDLTEVGVMYATNEKVYQYGYIVQPDDTYIFDINTSVETQWSSNAFPYLFKGVLALYGAYSKDNDIADFSKILNQAGII